MRCTWRYRRCCSAPESICSLASTSWRSATDARSACPVKRRCTTSSLERRDRRSRSDGRSHGSSRMIFDLFAGRRRAKLRAQPFPDEWRRIVERNLPIFRRLTPADQAELLGHVQVFLAEKHFEGLGGLALTDEIRLTIAAQACLLLLHRETDYYPRLRSILVYPSGYIARED